MTGNQPTALALAGVLALSGCTLQQCEIENPANLDRTPAFSLFGMPPAFQEDFTWPAPPRDVDREVEVRDGLDVANGYFESNSRLRVTAGIDRLVVDADDVVIEVAAGVRIERLVIGRGRQRIRVERGTFGTIELEMGFVLGGAEDATEQVTDVLFDRILVEPSEGDVRPGMTLVGERVALVDSRVSAGRAPAVVVGDATMPIPSTDIGIGRSTLETDGVRPAFVVLNAHRFVASTCWIRSESSYAVEVAGQALLPVLQGNTLVGGGVSMGERPRSQVERPWIFANRIHQTNGSLVALNPETLTEVQFVLNAIFSDRAGTRCVLCDREALPEGWNAGQNNVRPYVTPEAPPERP